MTTKHLSLPRLMIVSSGQEHGFHPGLAMTQALALGHSEPVIFQLREKWLEALDLHTLCSSLAPLLEAAGSILCINERFDIALSTGATGVHLPQSSCPPDVIRRAARGLLTGQSVHSLATALAAASAGVDYLLFGPVFHTPSKEPFGPPQGLQKLREVCRAVPVPVFAVGGITPDKTVACMEEGAYGVAALTPFIDAKRFPETIKHFQAFLSS